MPDCVSRALRELNQIPLYQNLETMTNLPRYSRFSAILLHECRVRGIHLLTHSLHPGLRMTIDASPSKPLSSLVGDIELRVRYSHISAMDSGQESRDVKTLNTSGVLTSYAPVPTGW